MRGKLDELQRDSVKAFPFTLPCGIKRKIGPSSARIRNAIIKSSAVPGARWPSVSHTGISDSDHDPDLPLPDG